MNEGDITEAQVGVFYDGVRQFFVTTYKYCVKWLPLDDPFIKSCIFVDFERRNSVTFDDVQTVISSFTRIHSKLVEEPVLLNTVEEYFMDYQSLTKEEFLQKPGKTLKLETGLFEWMLFGVS